MGNNRNNSISDPKPRPDPWAWHYKNPSDRRLHSYALDAGRQTCQCQRLKAGLVFWKWYDGGIERLVAKEFRFFVWGSSWVPQCYGMVKRISLRIMRINIPLLNSRTWRRMYLRKLLDDHRPMSIIIWTGVSSMNMVMAAAHLFERVPMSSGLKPNLSSPMLVALLQKEERRSSWVNLRSFPSIM